MPNIGLPEPPPRPTNSLTIDLAKMRDFVDFRRVRPAGSGHICKINVYMTGCQGFVFPNLQYIILIPTDLVNMCDLYVYWLI